MDSSDDDINDKSNDTGVLPTPYNLPTSRSLPNSTLRIKVHTLLRQRYEKSLRRRTWVPQRTTSPRQRLRNVSRWKGRRRGRSSVNDSQMTPPRGSTVPRPQTEVLENLTSTLTMSRGHGNSRDPRRGLPNDRNGGPVQDLETPPRVLRRKNCWRSTTSPRGKRLDDKMLELFSKDIARPLTHSLRNTQPVRWHWCVETDTAFDGLCSALPHSLTVSLTHS